MSWEIWKISDDETRIDEILDFGNDDGAARNKFNAMQNDAIERGGKIELRLNGKLVTFFSVMLPEVRKD